MAKHRTHSIEFKRSLRSSRSAMERMTTATTTGIATAHDSDRHKAGFETLRAWELSGIRQM